jgi:hypothetical protein
LPEPLSCPSWKLQEKSAWIFDWHRAQLLHLSCSVVRVVDSTCRALTGIVVEFVLEKAEKGVLLRWGLFATTLSRGPYDFWPTHSGSNTIAEIAPIHFCFYALWTTPPFKPVFWWPLPFL